MVRTHSNRVGDRVQEEVAIPVSDSERAVVLKLLDVGFSFREPRYLPRFATAAIPVDVCVAGVTYAQR
jgi:hypothetical protein